MPSLSCGNTPTGLSPLREWALSHPQPPRGALPFSVQPIKPGEQPQFIQLDDTRAAAQCAAVPAEGSACPRLGASLQAPRWLLLSVSRQLWFAGWEHEEILTVTGFARRQRKGLAVW